MREGEGGGHREEAGNYKYERDNLHQPPPASPTCPPALPPSGVVTHQTHQWVLGYKIPHLERKKMDVNERHSKHYRRLPRISNSKRLLIFN